MSKNTKRELLWLMVPALALVALGVGLQNRPAPPLPPIPTRPAAPVSVLVFEKLVVQTPSPHAVSQGYDTEVRVLFSHRGPRPAWWQDPSGRLETSGEVFLQGTRASVAARGFKWGAGYDPPTQRYIALYKFNTAHIPPGQALRLRDAVAPLRAGQMLCPPLAIDVLVSLKGGKTRVPLVSKDPHLKVTDWSLETVPAAADPEGKRRVRVVVQLRAPASRASLRPIIDSIRVVDAKGRELSLRVQGNVDNGDKDSMPRNRVNCQFDLDADQLQQTRGPLWLRVKTYHKAYWPLVFKIPLQGAAGTLLQSR